MKRFSFNDLKTWWKTNLLAGGERSIVSMGAAAVGVLLWALCANGWWMLSTAKENDALKQSTQLRTVGTLLSRSAEAMLSSGDLSATRNLVVQAARDFQLSRCRIVLGASQILADAAPSEINVKTLPESWPAETIDTDPGISPANTSESRFPILVRGKGTAWLELMNVPGNSWTSVWSAEIGLALIGAAGLGALLLVYRRNRAQLVAIDAITDALGAYGKGEAATAALAVNARFGPAAEAWNRLMGELDSLRHQALRARVSNVGQERRAAPNQFESVCDGMSQGLILIDDRQRVRFANGSASVFIGKKRDELMGQNISDVISDEKVRQAVQAIASDRSRRPVIVELESTANDKTVLRFNIRPARQEDSDAVTIIIEDITQLRASEQARNQFIAQVTHELRTPLTNIRLYVETAIGDNHTASPIQSKCLNVINQESRRLERIVGEMLSIAEIEAGSCSIHRSNVYLDVLLDELKDDYQAQAEEKQITLNFALPPKLPAVQVDRDKIALALHNLLGNALKYTPDGGKVTLSVDVRDGKVLIDVADTGIGISADETEKIFERFARSKDPRVGKIVGTGLGLTLAREVLRLHGGDITVQSELNRGSTFTATLPLGAEAA